MVQLINKIKLKYDSVLLSVIAGNGGNDGNGSNSDVDNVDNVDNGDNGDNGDNNNKNIQTINYNNITLSEICESINVYIHYNLVNSSSFIIIII